MDIVRTRGSRTYDLGTERTNRETPRNAIYELPQNCVLASLVSERPCRASLSELHVFVGERVIFLGRFSILANVVKIAICGTNLQFLFFIRISVRNSIRRRS